MRALVVLVALVAVIALFAIPGCSVTKNAAEVRNDAAQSLDLDARQIVDDWNMIWMVDRQYRMTRWHTR